MQVVSYIGLTVMRSAMVNDLFSNFYAPVSKDRGHIVLPLFVFPFVWLHKRNVKT